MANNYHHLSSTKEDCLMPRRHQFDANKVTPTPNTIHETFAERPIIDSYSKAIANRGKRTLYLKHLESNRKLAGWLYKYQLIDTDTYIATLGRIRRDLMRP